jgi:hypothetical protein
MTPAMIQLLLGVLIQYGPGAVSGIVALYKKATSGTPVTVDEVEALFAQIKPYEAYNIPTIIPPPAA